MKVNQTQDGFQPITITIETLDEALVLRAVMGNVKGEGKYRRIAEEFYEAVENQTTYRQVDEIFDCDQTPCKFIGE